MAKNTIPSITVPEGMLTVQTHDKYGDSLVMEGNTVMLNGKLHRINTFKTYEKVLVNGRVASVTIPHISFREVEADVPNVPKELAVKPGKNGKPETFKTSEVSTGQKASDSDMEEFKEFLKFKAMKAAAAK